MSISTKRLALGGVLIAVLVAAAAVVGTSLVSSPSTDAPGNVAAMSSEAVEDSSVPSPPEPVSLERRPPGVTEDGISPEYLEAIGATPVSSPAEAATGVSFQPRIPEVLRGRNREAIYTREIVAADGTPEVEITYALYGDVIATEVFYYSASWKSPEEFAHTYDRNTGAEAYLLYFEVNGIPAHGWDRGVYDALGEDGSPITIGNGSSQISWLQDGVVRLVGSESLTTRDLLPMAEAIARTAPAK